MRVASLFLLSLLAVAAVEAGKGARRGFLTHALQMEREGSSGEPQDGNKGDKEKDKEEKKDGKGGKDQGEMEKDNSDKEKAKGSQGSGGSEPDLGALMPGDLITGMMGRTTTTPKPK
eukprot:GDKI01010214.1.p1 GENE.GDKI01010214.1~~GDKI01010214.1.p1  ORF type:complete len:117 (-),score=27.44 GDKI01010214.1:64-414(-)